MQVQGKGKDGFPGVSYVDLSGIDDLEGALNALGFALGVGKYSLPYLPFNYFRSFAKQNP